MIVVSDTSPITALITLEEIDTLQKLFGSVLIPKAVQAELSRSHSSLPPWIQVVEVAGLEKAIHFQSIVDPGEAEAIVLAQERNAEFLLIDDLHGRALADQQRLRTIGLLGVLVLARKQRLIPPLKPLVERLRKEARVRLSDSIVADALRLVGEA